ncbi:hypothetical protein SD71_06655 [Cohnella kolymensis]|uniref:Dynamin-type G domain-containing protein n=1 Tax=Cohnella kolymensis TaxID=1590652 RepID=A0ABR5A6M8_9BACL|nr:dynamin family protein [Cohnella kolymensis]KIL36677.1 hypothetical protein SD71_06655 [Cohnella kolymensis]
MGIEVDRLDFLANKQQLHNVFTELKSLLTASGFGDRIEAAIQRLHRERMNLLVVGEFSRGKSTFINALLGSPVLPSKVNPTTATINVIVPGTESKMEMIYHDGRREEQPLPSDKINKFLEDKVTVANQQANEIRQVVLTLPGPMEEWNCTIVDTPGVNDLEDMREDVTFRYLRQADACIVLLDAHQPLSRSERAFIRDKVLANDIHRLMFVINRMDESAPMPDGEIAARLKTHVFNLLREELPDIVDPLVHAVSSKETLRAKFKSENSMWRDSFALFERELYRFLSGHATQGRLPDHADAAIGIAADGLRAVRDELSVQAGNGEEFGRQILRLEQEARQREEQLEAVSVYLDGQSIELARRLRKLVEDGFGALRERLAEQAALCDNEEDLQRLKSSISSGVRDQMQALAQELSDYKRELSRTLADRFRSLFSDEYSLPVVLGDRSLNSWQGDRSVDLGIQGVNTADASDTPGILLGYAAAGGMLGYIGAALLGPIGVAAAIVGSLIMGGKFEEERKRKAYEQAKEQAIQQLRAQIGSVIEHAREHAEHMAQTEIAPLEARFRDRIRSRLHAIRRLLQEQTDSVKLDRRSTEERADQLRALGNRLKDILENLYLIRRPS